MEELSLWRAHVYHSKLACQDGFGLADLDWHPQAMTLFRRSTPKSDNHLVGRCRKIIFSKK